MHCINMWCPQNVFSEFLLLLFRDILLIFLLHFFQSMYTFLFFLQACLFVELFFLYIFHSYVFCFFKLVFNFMHFSFIGHSEKQ